MSITAAELLVMVKAEGASNVELSLAAVSAAVIAAGVESVKMAGDFQQSMTQLVTGAGESRSNLKMVSDGILQMSIDTATATDKLASGMFNVESAGYRGATGLKVLKAAAEGAKAENADLGQTTDVLTTTMHGLHAGASQAVSIMNSLIATERDGKMHMDDLTGAMKNVLPVSAALHIKLSDVEGALATMAEGGDRGASAGTHLAMMFKMLENPASTAANEMKAMGIDSVKLAETMSTSLPAALQMIQDAVAQHFTPGSVEYERAIAKILGGSKSGIAGLELLGQNFKDLGTFTNDAAEALRKGGVDVENWDLIQSNFNFQLEAAANAINVLMIKIGTALLPVLGKLFENVTPTISAFSQWIDKSGILAGITQTLSGWVGKLGEAFNYVADAFNQVFNPIKQVASAFQFIDIQAKPLLDTFDRATAIFKQTQQGLQPLADTFDRASYILNHTSQAAAPLLDTFDRATAIFGETDQKLSPLADTFDRATAIFQKTNDTVAQAPNIWIPFWQEVKHLRDQIMTIDWGGIGAGLERIRVAISQMDWGKVGAFFSGIATSISKVDWGKVGKDIENIAIGLTKVDWGKVGAAFAGIVNSLLKVDWGKTGANLKSIFDELSKVDWKSTVDGIVEVITEFQKVIAFFQLFGDALNFAANLAGVVARKIVEFFQWLYDRLVGHSIIPDLINGIVTWFASLPGRLAGVIIGTVNSIVNWFAQLPGRLGALIIGLVNSIAGWWGEVPGRLAAFGGSIISALTSPFQSAANTISGILGTIGGWVNTAVGNVGNLISKISQVHIPSFASGIENFGGGLAYVHAGEVLTYLSPGTSVTPASKVGSMGGSAPVIHNHIDVYLDGTRMTGQLMPRIVQQVRQATGVRF